MPTPEQCQELKVTQVRQETRMDAVAERLDEVLDEVKEIRAVMNKYLDLATAVVNNVGMWLGKWIPVLVAAAILGTQILPLISKMYA